MLSFVGYIVMTTIDFQKNINGYLRIYFWVMVFASMVYSINHLFTTPDNVIVEKQCFNLVGKADLVEIADTYNRNPGANDKMAIYGYDEKTKKRFRVLATRKDVLMGRSCVTHNIDNTNVSGLDVIIDLYAVLSIIMLIVFGFFVILPWAFGEIEFRLVDPDEE